jgi:hypothetical protein
MTVDLSGTMRQPRFVETPLSSVGEEGRLGDRFSG